MKKETDLKLDKKPNIYYYILKRQDIAKFSYYDYLYLERQKMIHCNEIAEPSKSYNLTNVNNKTIQYEHDKTYRKLLSNPKEAARIINEALFLTEENYIKPAQIEKYATNFITSQFENRQADVVYKMKSSDTYFLMEHQSKVDYSINYRLQEYKSEIFKSAVDITRIKQKSYKLPVVVAIVLYTGKRKWTVNRYLEQVYDPRFEDVNLLEYSLVDINEYTKEELLDSEYLIDKILLISKIKDASELAETIDKIISKIQKEDRKTFIEIIAITLKEKLGKTKIVEIINKIKKEEERDMIEEVAEMLRKSDMKIRREAKKEGIKKGMKEGMKEGIIKGIGKILQSMVQNGMTLEEIKKVTGLTDREIEEARKIQTKA